MGDQGTQFSVPHVMQAFYSVMLVAGWTRPNDGLPGQFHGPHGERTRIVHSGGRCEISYARKKNPLGADWSIQFVRPYGHDEKKFRDWLADIAKAIISGCPAPAHV